MKLSTVIGAVSGTVFDLLIDFPLSDLGAYYAWQIRDAAGRYVWGVGTGDLLGAAIGSGLTAAGHFLKIGDLKEAGLGWLLALGCIKLSELYTYLTAIKPVTPKVFSPTLKKVSNGKALTPAPQIRKPRFH
jgi:hypothetical protein